MNLGIRICIRECADIGVRAGGSGCIVICVHRIALSRNVRLTVIYLSIIKISTVFCVVICAVRMRGRV